MKQEPGRQQPGISGLQAGEDVKEAEIMELLSGLEALGGTWSHSDAAKKAA